MDAEKSAGEAQQCAVRLSLRTHSPSMDEDARRHAEDIAYRTRHRRYSPENAKTRHESAKRQQNSFGAQSNRTTGMITIYLNLKFTKLM